MWCRYVRPPARVPNVHCSRAAGDRVPAPLPRSAVNRAAARALNRDGERA